MRTIAKLFGRSPFVPVQHHMELVATAVDQLPAVLNAYLGGDQQQVEQLAGQITAAEESADQMRRDIQRTIKKGIFLAVERSRMVKMVTLQDRLADKAGNVAQLLTLKPCTTPPPFAGEVRSLVEANLQAFAAVRKIIDELDELLETSFGGPEAQLVQQLVREVQQRERDADAAQMRTLKAVFNQDDDLSHAAFYLWMRVLKQTASIADLSEALADRVQSVLQLK